MIAHIPGGAYVASVMSALLLAVAFVLVIVPRGSRRLRRRARMTAWGLCTLGLAVSPPAEVLAEATFSAHMLQHLAIMVIAPAALAFGRAWSTVLDAAHRLGLGPARRWEVARRCNAD